MSNVLGTSVDRHTRDPGDRKKVANYVTHSSQTTRLQLTWTRALCNKADKLGLRDKLLKYNFKERNRMYQLENVKVWQNRQWK